MMIVSRGFSMLPPVRRQALAAVGAALLSLSGCASLTLAPAYVASSENVYTLASRPASKIALGPFIQNGETLNKLTLRGSPYDSPYNGSYAEYLKAALRTELEAAGKLDETSTLVVSAELLENSLDAASSSENTARISAHVMVMREGYKAFDKVVSAESQWPSSSMDAVAISAARRNYPETVKKFLANLIENRDFQIAIMPLRLPPAAMKASATRVSPDDILPGNCAKPEYPRVALRYEQEGSVTVRLVLDTDGHVIDGMIERSSGFTALDDATMQAWFICRFKPAIRNGVPIKSTVRMKYIWRLE
jgi:TonB family protein